MAESEIRLPAERKAADLDMIRRLKTAPVRPRRGRRRAVVLGGGVAVFLGGGVATAAVIQHFTAVPASDTRTGRCYTTAVRDFGDDFPGTSAGNAYRPGDDPRVISDTLLADCSVLWQHGELKEGQPDGTYQDAANFPVPALSVCVLPNGQAAVFPGKNICDQIGLPALLEK